MEQNQIKWLVIAYLCFLNLASFAQRADLVIQKPMTKRITGLVYSKDGSLLASSSADGNVIIWDTKTYKQIRVFEGAASSQTSTSMDFSLDGRAILLAKSGGLKLFDIASGALLKEYFKPVDVFKPGIVEAVFSLDNQFIYSCGGSIEKRNSKTGDVVQTYEPVIARKGNSLFSGFTSLSVSQASNLLAASSVNDSSVHIFDLTTGQWITKLHKKESLINTVRFSNRGNLLAVAHLGGLNVWNVENRQFTLYMSDSSAYSAQKISFCADDNCLVMAGLTGYLARLDFKFVSKRYGSSYDGVYPALNPKNTTMAVGINTELFFLDFKTGVSLHHESGKLNELGTVEVSANDRYLVSKTNHGDWIKESYGRSINKASHSIWDLSLGKPILQLSTDCLATDRFQNIYGYAKPDSLYWVTDPGSFAANKKKINRKSYDTIYIHDFVTGKRLKKINGLGKVNGLGFFNEGKSIFVLGEEVLEENSIRTIGRVIDWATGRLLAEIKDTVKNNRPTLYSNFTINEKYGKICAGGISGKLTCWNLDGQWAFSAPVYSGKFSSDGELLAMGAMDRLYINYLKEDKEVGVDAFTMLSSTLYDINATSNLLATKSSLKAQEKIDIYNLSSKQLVRTLSGHKGNINSIRFFNHSDTVASTAGDNLIKLWNPKDTSEFVSLMLVDSAEWILFTPDNYYMTSKGGTRNIGFRVGNRAYAFDQFDLQYNRPDIILSKIGKADPALIQSYKKAYLKRLKKMNFSEQSFNSDFHVPDLSIVNKNDISPNQEKAILSLKIKAEDTRYKINRINIWVNQVSIFSTHGFDLTAKNTSLFAGDFEIPLSAGRNKIRVSCHNEKGVESLSEALDIQYKPLRPEKPDLYIFSIGISRYKQAAYSLQYADKDATDMATWFSSNKDTYRTINNYKLINEQVTKEAILNIKQKLNDARIDDHVIIFYAGHGVLDKNLNYYLSTHDMNFTNPGGKGLSYEMLEGILDGVKPRNKLLLIDACHSGEVDKEDVTLAAGEKQNTQVTFRSVNNQQVRQIGLENSFEVMKELFSDLRRGNGTTVISSAGGAEYAMESATWNNGVFSYSFLSGLKEKKADLNRDGVIMLSEIQRYVQDQVSSLTMGKQKPTSRIENTDVDFRIH